MKMLYKCSIIIVTVFAFILQFLQKARRSHIRAKRAYFQIKPWNFTKQRRIGIAFESTAPNPIITLQIKMNTEPIFSSFHWNSESIFMRSYSFDFAAYPLFMRVPN